MTGQNGKDGPSHGSTERHERRAEPTREILNIDEAADLLGVSIKTFNKVLHSQDMPARKIGREWKFSRRALIEWVGSGRAAEFYREDREENEEQVEQAEQDGRAQPGMLTPREPGTLVPERPKARRTAGWQIEYD